jgi:hypothetical protein
MSRMCHDLHKIFNNLKKYNFSFDEKDIPLNGIYVLFQKGETGHDNDRIVRIGTHTGNNQLRSRLKQHFLNENKDRSIFRKNIGRCILNKRKDKYLDVWELDLTERVNKDKYSSLIDKKYQQQIETEITNFLHNNFYFVVIRVDDKDARLMLESKIISTVSKCKECKPSKDWLGLYSPKDKIKESGLWLVNELYKEELNENDFKMIEKLLEESK